MEDNFIVESNKTQLEEIVGAEVKEETTTEPSSNEPEVKTEPEAQANAEVKPHGKSRAQKRIETLVPSKSELNPDDFEDYDDYLEAVEKIKSKEVTKEAKTDDSLVIEQVKEKFEDTREKYDDFDDKVEGMPILTVDMLRVLNESDEAGEVAYYLANNPKEAKRLSQLSLGKMAIEVGKIELKLSMPEAPKPITKKVTTAQEPITPVGGANLPARSLSEATSQAEYEAMRSAQQKPRNGWA
jgi:hypothetical protein